MIFVKADDISKIDVKARRAYNEPQGAEVYRAIGSLPIGEGVVVHKSEWAYKNQPTPSAFPRRFIPRGAAYRVNTLTSETGWVIRRVK